MTNRYRIGCLEIDESLHATVGDREGTEFANCRSAELLDLRRARLQVQEQLEIICPELMKKLELLDRAIEVKVNHLVEYYEHSL